MKILALIFVLSILCGGCAFKNQAIQHGLSSDIEIIMNPQSSEDSLARAIHRQKKSLPFGFWLGIANNDDFSCIHRRRCLVALFEMKQINGLTISQLANLLHRPAWLRAEDITILPQLRSGPIPVSSVRDSTVWCINLMPTRSQSDRAVYITTVGNLDLEALRSALLGGAPYPDSEAKLNEVGVSRDLVSERYGWNFSAN